MNPRQSRDMASEILKYLKSHPDAADSLEGIMNWWQSDGDRSREEVEIALNSLVIQHILERVENQQRQVIYRVRAARQHDPGE